MPEERAEMPSLKKSVLSDDVKAAAGRNANKAAAISAAFVQCKSFLFNFFSPYK